jgi:predicted outer membrane protein
MMRVLATVASIFMLLAVPAAGQRATPPSPLTPAQNNPTTRSLSMPRSAWRINLGKLAEQRSQNDAVKEFARSMVTTSRPTTIDRVVGRMDRVPKEVDERRRCAGGSPQ